MSEVNYHSSSPSVSTAFVFGTLAGNFFLLPQGVGVPAEQQPLIDTPDYYSSMVASSYPSSEWVIASGESIGVHDRIAMWFSELDARQAPLGREFSDAISDIWDIVES
jgi:hypothetical protein